ncbi:MAG TPA: hypothetical protein VKN36_17460 [Eudoraea sp.]|nr:hypothetical protein [Eudoraea sp.]
MIFKTHPVTSETFKVPGLLLLPGALFFFFLQFPFHALVDIVFKSSLIFVMYTGILYRFRISEHVFGILSK